MPSLPVRQYSRFITHEGEFASSLTEARIRHPGKTIYEVDRRRMNMAVGSPVWGEHELIAAHEPGAEKPRNIRKAEREHLMPMWQQMGRSTTPWTAVIPNAGPGARPLGPGGTRL